MRTRYENQKMLFEPRYNQIEGEDNFAWRIGIIGVHKTLCGFDLVDLFFANKLDAHAAAHALNETGLTLDEIIEMRQNDYNKFGDLITKYLRW